MTRPRRAPPLDRAARRAKIIEAVAPLLAARGGAVTTRELAQAAGVAEGTLFSVFDDKRSLMLAAIQGRLDPEPLRARLAGLATLPTIEAKLLGVWKVIIPRVEEFHALFVAMRRVMPGAPPMPPPTEETPRGSGAGIGRPGTSADLGRRGSGSDGGRRGPPTGLDSRGDHFDRSGPPGLMQGWVTAAIAQVTELLAPHAAELRESPSRLAQLYVTLLLASRMPQAEGEPTLNPKELVDFCLNGALKRQDER